MAKALGLLETKGFLAAIVGADAALKAAMVTLHGVEKVGGGLMTVVLTGEVAAVAASLAAAEAAAVGLTSYCQSHLIARLDDEVAPVLKLDEPGGEPPAPPKPPATPPPKPAGRPPKITAATEAAPAAPPPVPRPEAEVPAVRPEAPPPAKVKAAAAPANPAPPASGTKDEEAAPKKGPGRPAKTGAKKSRRH